MNYVDIIARQSELEVEMQELQAARIAAAQSHENIFAKEDISDNVSVELDINYDNMDASIINIDDHAMEAALFLTVEQFNKINQFLGKYNDAIFSYMSELTKQSSPTEEVTEEVSE